MRYLLPLLLLLVVVRPAHAQDAEVRARASEHFDRGIAFFNEGRFDAALAELDRAYELAPAHQVLYNLARVHAALGHAVEAADAYARYLEEAGDSIRPRRRREAERALEEQRERIGRLEVVTGTSGATVAVDGVDVATTPLEEPILVSAGMHNVEIRAPGRETVRRAISIAGETTERVEVELRDEVVPRGILRVVSSLPEVTISIDGEAVGLTPLRSTVPLRAGVHEVTAIRAGYRPETRRVNVEEGAEAEVSFELRREPSPSPEHVGRIRIHLPDAPSLVRVDGEPMIGVDLELPVGAHHVEIEVTDRRPYEGTVRVPARDALSIRPSLSWTLEARRERLDAAQQQRLLGLGLAVGGATVLAGALGVVIWNETEISSTDARVVEVNREIAETCPGSPRCLELEDEGRRLLARQDEQNVIRGISISALVVGAALAVPGLIVWLTAPSEEDVDAQAQAALVVRPGGLELRGRF